MDQILISYRQRKYLDHTSGILTGLILFCLALALSACNSSTISPTHTQTATLTTVPAQPLTPHPSTKFVPTKSPTVSFTASATPEPTWTPQPTSTPLVPTPAAALSYRLTHWTPEKAEQLIQQLREYPETLTPQLMGYMGLGYYAAFRYEGLAELESTLRFPQAEQAKTWRRNGTYNQFMSGNDDASSLYAGWIASALNQQETSVQDLQSWFVNSEPRMVLETYPIRSISGYQQSIVLYIKPTEGNDISGGFAIWLLQKEGTFIAYPLHNNTELFFVDGYSRMETADITGDGIAEAIIQNTDWQSFGMHSGDLVIYRLDQIPPQKITIEPELHEPDIAEWSVTPGSITFQIPVSTGSDLPCGPVTTGWQYRWQGGKLKLVRYLPPSGEAESEMEVRTFCARILVNILANHLYLDNRTVLTAYKQMLELPYIAQGIYEHERPYSVEKQRFNLALYLSSKGDEAGAAEQMRLIHVSTDPTLAEWRQDAVAFFAVHRDPQALLQYCLTSEKCGTFLNREELIALIPPNRFSEVEILLEQVGIKSSLYGSYDFDQDGQPEKWLLFQGSYYCDHQFLILARDENEIKIHSPFGSVCLQQEGEVVKEIEIRQIASSGGLPGYQVTFNGIGPTDEEFLYWPLNQEDPTVDFREAKRMNDAIQNKLMLGQISPGEARSQLLAIQTLPLEPGMWMVEVETQQRYLIGLTYELTGEGIQAAQTYLELWQSYPDSPYAIMAYAKLEQVP